MENECDKEKCQWKQQGHTLSTQCIIILVYQQLVIKESIHEAFFTFKLDGEGYLKRIC